MIGEARSLDIVLKLQVLIVICLFRNGFLLYQYVLVRLAHFLFLALLQGVEGGPGALKPTIKKMILLQHLVVQIRQSLSLVNVFLLQAGVIIRKKKKNRSQLLWTRISQD